MRSEDYGTIVTVIVGTSEQRDTFLIYKGLLENYSHYFKDALKVKSEDDNKTLTLPEDDPVVFKAFFHWLFTGSLFPMLEEDGTIPLSARRITDIFIFGEKIGAPDLCNSAIDLLYQKMDQWKTLTWPLLYAYEHTPPHSILRKWIRDRMVETCQFTEWRNSTIRDIEHYPKDLLADIIVGLTDPDSMPNPAVAGSRGEGNAFSWESYSESIKLLYCKRYHQDAR